LSQILLVSADRELARFLKSALRDTPLKVTYETASVKMAADIVAGHPIGLTVLDFFLPDSSGLEALKVLKRVNEQGLFLLLTRLRTRIVLERAFRLGAQDVLHYPVSEMTLRDTILHRLAAQALGDAEDSERALKTARKK